MVADGELTWPALWLNDLNVRFWPLAAVNENGHFHDWFLFEEGVMVQKWYMEVGSAI